MYIHIYIINIYIVYTGPILEIEGMDTFFGGTFVEKRAFCWLASPTHAMKLNTKVYDLIKLLKKNLKTHFV